ncbi:crotonase/enoyl-CoA hydratase family protein [Eoetvoesiella caeni]|uniref:Vanillin synthase /trans-feruloyl-CoA hydratase n=1 Tax=Eoetvoesiella caeni TaxID=645616 RepID=A0A366HH85_9BURK|nr:crotonase/enoyl-CoA hydratase family protein [Eoetvoesiella caeni]MCI2808068.1 crotonase/enoyl-CoA hydratase family protein [Eoetvoesiella caeni]NYT53929.1 crotonase/enoyl-CoA hydratase family protein [Eoetvoesiella caeni]RBP41988.1 vanillin synthase /trans-feruloyl-CoA hydratase [Eoetvoesiella caeni]
MSQPDYSHLLSVKHIGAVAQVRITRPNKRNALNEDLVMAIKACFESMPESVKAIVLYGEGDHFCAGLDLSEVSAHTVPQSVLHSRMWHAAFEHVQFGRAPVIAVLHGAVVGGGFELASAAHIRVAEESAFYALPEGKRGLFVGGGGSVRISRLIGVARMSDLMLTGRVLNAQEGHQIGISQYSVGNGQGLAKAMELAESIATNAAMTNYGVMHMLPRIADQSIQDGLATESLMAAVAQTDPATLDLLAQFLQGKKNKVQFKPS